MHINYLCLIFCVPIIHKFYNITCVINKFSVTEIIFLWFECLFSNNLSVIDDGET